jgi:hypothetical protein
MLPDAPLDADFSNFNPIGGHSDDPGAPGFQGLGGGGFNGLGSSNASGHHRKWLRGLFDW